MKNDPQNKIKRELEVLLREHGMDAIASECLNALLDANNPTLTEYVGPRDHILHIYKRRAELNAARRGIVQGYETLIPAIETYIGPEIRIYRIQKDRSNWVLFTSGDMSHILGLLHNPNVEPSGFTEE